MDMWHEYPSVKPEIGQRCLFTLSGRDPDDPVIDGEYHNVESFEAKYGELEFSVHDSYHKGFFMETGSEDEWWESPYVRHWTPLNPPPPKEGNGK